MKYKEYIELEEVKKILEPISDLVPLLNILSIIQMLGNEIGGDFSDRVSDFCDKEKENILNIEIKVEKDMKK